MAQKSISQFIQNPEELRIQFVILLPATRDVMDCTKLIIAHTKTCTIDCYSGWRPMELCNLTVNDIDLIEGTMKGGMKTEAGRNRIVPIHSAIKPLVIDYYNLAKKTGSEYIFTSNGRPFTYSMYYKAVVRTVEQLSLDPEHKTHDCRKHFITACKKSNVDEYAIKYLVGHTIKDLTERVYTERSVEWLKTEIEKIKSECRNGV